MADLSAVDIVQVVYSLRSGVTSLKKTSIVRGRGVNLSGPCPVCKGHDRFYVLPDAEDTQGQRRGKWACRNCHAKEGDAIELLTFMDGLSEADAFARLKELFPVMSGGWTPGRAIVNLDAERKYRIKPLSENALPPSVQWQKRARQIIEAAIARLWDDSTGAEALDYLLSRGLTKETIQAAKLGFIPLTEAGRDILDKASKWGIDDREDMILPSGILFPYEYTGDIWKLRIRRLGNVAKDKRYTAIPGSSNGLYRADTIAPGQPLAAFEGEIDALSAYQSIGDAMACVAFGSTMHARIPAWTIRLSLASEILLCFDNEAEETKTSGAVDYWTSRLENARIHRTPEAYHDCNDMLQKQGDIQQWLLSGLCSDAAASAIARPGVQVQADPLKPCLYDGCSVQVDREALSFAWCEAHVTSGLFMDTGADLDYPSLPGQKRGYEAWLETARMSSPGRLDELYTLIDRQEIPEASFLSIAHQMKEAIETLSGKPCELRVLPKGYTLAQHIEDLRQERADAERNTIKDIHSRRRKKVYERAMSS